MTDHQEHYCEHTFEYAYCQEDRKGVLTATMRLPSLSDLHAITHDLSLEHRDHINFCELIAADWRRGAVAQYFDKNCNMGRWLTACRGATLTEHNTRVTAWFDHSSKMHSALTESPVDVNNIRKHINQTAHSTGAQVQDADRSDRRGTFRPIRPSKPKRP